MSGKINIVYDVSYPFVEGGGQKRIYEVARRLTRIGWKIQWFSFKTWEGARCIERDGISYIGLDGFVPLYNASGRRSWREALAFGRAVWKNRKAIRDADVLWCGQWPYSHLSPLLYPGKPRLYVDWWEVWGRHWFEYFNGWGSVIGYAGERLFARLCSRRGIIIAISARGVRELVSVGARTKSVRMIPNGIDISGIEHVRPASEMTDLIYVGRLKNHKNVDHILKAMRVLRTEHNINARAVIVGTGPAEEMLRALVAETGLASTVRFRGSLDEEGKFAHIKSASIFVHPSTKEGGGSLTVLEAHACGVPVIIYDAPQGIDPEYIQEGATGWIVKPATPESLAAQLAKLLGDKSSSRNVTSSACLESAKRYDWDRIAMRYHSLFAEPFGEQYGRNSD